MNIFVVPKIHAFGAEDAEALLSKAHKTMTARLKTLDSPPSDGVPTEQQYDEIRFIVAQTLLHEFRASIEMDAFEIIDGYCAINGEPETEGEISAFWSEIVPMIVKPILAECERLQGMEPMFEIGEHQPWTGPGLRAFCIALASKLRAAVLDGFDNESFTKATELDTSRIALLGTTEWVEAGESAKTATGSTKPPAPPPPPKPPVAEGLDATAVDKPTRGRPRKDAVMADQDLVSSIWVTFGQSVMFEVSSFCDNVKISTPTMRNYTAGKKSKLKASQAAIIRSIIKDRLDKMNAALALLDRFDATPGAIAPE